MSPASENLLAFIAAAVAPAAITGLLFLAALGPAGFFLGFLFAFLLAGAHVALLAFPIYAALSRRREPGPALVLASSFLIGAVPLPLLFGLEQWGEGFLFFGLFGVSGGIAFVLVSAWPAEDRGGR
jgi:hypothetical protein